jgi:U3 small nucleolar RNA-associated protein 14
MEESSESEGAQESDEDEDSDAESDTEPEDGASRLGKLMAEYGAKDDEPGRERTKKPDFAIIDDEKETVVEKTKTKISLSDLGLSDLKDLNMRKSVKLMTKEEKETRPGESRKVLKPLPKLHQDRIDRQAAFDTTVKTLDRWTETIKSNRRADHLVFPLPHDKLNAGLSNTDFQPINPKLATSELEQTMLELLGPNGFDKEPKTKKKAEETDPEVAATGLGVRAEEIRKRKEELVNQRRLERELQSREAKKHSRLKKIKSKAFHRVHRRQKLKDMQDDESEVDSEAEREAHDRRRALERVGARHKNSAWGKKAQRAVWDDNYRTGLTEAARKEHELRKRVEGRKDSESEDESSDGSASDSEAERDRLLRRVDEVEADTTQSKNQLMNLKFMRTGEERLRLENEKLMSDIRNTLGEGVDEEAREEEEGPVVGRRTYGPAANSANLPGTLVSVKDKPTKELQSLPVIPNDTRNDGDDVDVYTGDQDNVYDPNAWSKGKPRKGGSGTRDAGLIRRDIDFEPVQPAQPKPGKKSAPALEPEPSDPSPFDDDEEPQGQDSEGEDSGEEAELLDDTDRLILEAFGGGDEVLDEFEKEKEEIAEEEDDKVIDNTLPGWGSWVGDGVSAKEKKKHAGRFLQKVEGVKKKDRSDAKLERVIINEQRVKKVCDLFFLSFSTSRDRSHLAWNSRSDHETERAVPGLHAAPSIRVQGAVRAIIAAARGQGVGDEGDLPRWDEA